MARVACLLLAELKAWMTACVSSRSEGCTPMSNPVLSAHRRMRSLRKGTCAGARGAF